jgi:hypothetical protein
MRRSSDLAALVLSLAIALAAPRAGVAQIQDQKPSLVGTWRLVSVTARLDKGDVIADAYGPHPEGLLTYTANGRVAGLEVYDGRKPLSVGDRESAPVEERAEAFSLFISYAGSYKVAGDKVKHHIEASSLENDVNTNLVIKFRFEGPDRLVLLAPPLVRNGARQVQEKVWERVK